MGIFDRFAKDILEVTQPTEKPGADIARAGQAFTGAFKAGIAPVIQKEAKDILTGEYSFDTDTRDLIKRLDPQGKRGWLNAAKEFELGIQGKDKKRMELARKKRLEFIPSKSRLKRLEQQQLGFEGATDNLLKERFKSVEDLAKGFVDRVATQMPKLKSSEKTFMQSFIKDINQFYNSEAISAGKPIATANTLIREGMDKGIETLNEALDRFKAEYKNRIEQMADMPEEEKLKAGLDVLLTIEKLDTEQGKKLLFQSVGNDMANKALQEAGANQKDLTPSFHPTRFYQDAGKFAELVIKNSVEDYDKTYNDALKDLYNEIRNSLYGKESRVGTFFSDVFGRIPELGETKEFIKKTKKYQGKPLPIPKTTTPPTPAARSAPPPVK